MNGGDDLSVRPRPVQHAEDEVMPRQSNALATRTSMLCRPGKRNGAYPGAARHTARSARAEMRVGPGSEAGTTKEESRRPLCRPGKRNGAYPGSTYHAARSAHAKMRVDLGSPPRCVGDDVMGVGALAPNAHSRNPRAHGDPVSIDVRLRILDPRLRGNFERERGAERSTALTPWRVRCQTSRGTSAQWRRHWGV